MSRAISGFGFINSFTSHFPPRGNAIVSKVGIPFAISTDRTGRARARRNGRKCSGGWDRRRNGVRVRRLAGLNTAAY
jgi:hypothetical protein